MNLSTYFVLNRAPRLPNLPPYRWSLSISALVLAAAVFRAEVVAYLAPLCLYALYQGVTPKNMLATGLVSGVLSTALTVGVDSYFWQQKLLWPEMHSILFNVVEGKSAEWGVSPPSTYFKALLPKLLLSSLPLSIIGVWYSRAIRNFVTPSLIFVGLMSCLGHKEWRFIVYVVPIFNIAASRGLYAM